MTIDVFSGIKIITYIISWTIFAVLYYRVFPNILSFFILAAAELTLVSEVFRFSNSK